MLSYTNQDRFELQNFTRLVSGKHNIRWGGLLRAISLHDRATQSYAGTFPANQYDLSPEYGRAGFDVRHRVHSNGSISMPWGLRLSPFPTVASGRPYNITVGRDLNGDSLYLDRPAFGRSTGLMGGGQGGNRRFDLQLRYDF